MAKLTKVVALGAIAIAAAWSAGIWCSGHYAETIIGKALDELNSNLERRHSSGSLNFGIKTAYEVSEKGFFSQKGNILVTPDGMDKPYRVPVEIEHGFLRLTGNADLFHFLNNLLLKSEILRRDGAEARAYVDFRLFPMNYNLSVIVDGTYSEGFFIRDEKQKYRQAGDSRRVHGFFKMHRATFGTVSTYVTADNLYTPYGSIGSVFMHDLYDEDAVGLGKVELDLNDMNLRGTAVDELYSLKADVNSLKAASAENFGIKVKLAAKTTKGEGYAVLSAGDFSSKALDETGGSIIEALASPLLLSQYLASGNAWLKLEDLKFNVDFQNPDDHVAYDIAGHGALTYPAGDIALSDVNGNFSFSFENVNAGGEKVVDMLGRNIFVKNARGYTTDIVIDEGRLSFNGKHF